MSNSRDIRSLWFVILIFFMLLFLLISSSNASEEIKAAVKSMQQSQGQSVSDEEGDEEVTYKTIRIKMQMEAGAAQYKEWPGGKRTIHSGIGWIQPFGRA